MPWKALISQDPSTIRQAVRILVALLLALVFAGDVRLLEASAAGKEGVRKGLSDTVRLRAKGRVGSYLTDAKGMTLYYSKKDAPGKSACAGDCITRWPVFYTKQVVVSGKLDKKDFSVITRDDGIRQTTYKGRPLYYFARDAAPGEMNGEGVHNAWQVMIFGKIKK